MRIVSGTPYYSLGKFKKIVTVQDHKSVEKTLTGRSGILFLNLP